MNSKQLVVTKAEYGIMWLQLMRRIKAIHLTEPEFFYFLLRTDHRY